MDFSEALVHLKSGSRVYRKNWNGVVLGKEMYLYKNESSPQLYLILWDGKEYNIGWIPTVKDMFAEDWEIYIKSEEINS